MLKREHWAHIVITFDFSLPVYISKKRNEVHKSVSFSGNKHLCSCNILPCLIFSHIDGAKQPSLPTWQPHTALPAPRGAATSQAGLGASQMV